jgi:hypothetical protein
MTSPPSPPNRRRRWIVVTIAVLALGLGWWFRPRVDQRFVGKWVVDPSDVPSGYRVFTFNADHRGEEMVDTTTTILGKTYLMPKSRMAFHWWVDGDRLLIQDGSNRSTNKATLLLSRLVSSFTGTPLPSAYDLRLETVSDASLSLLRYDQLRPVSLPTRLTLRRVEGWPPPHFAQ